MSKSTDIRKFKKFTAEIKYEPICEEYGTKARNILRDPNVSPSSGRPNRSTPYWQGWDVQGYSFPHAHRVIVWNKTNWQLTHLLENGHFITNHGALAWSPPIAHIKPTFDRIEPRFIRAMRMAEIKTKIN